MPNITHHTHNIAMIILPCRRKQKMMLIAGKRQEEGLGVRALPKEEMPKRRCTQEHGERKRKREGERGLSQ
jgi:hypothetical protein